MCLHEYKKRYLYQISTTYNVYNQVNIVNFVVKLGKGCRVKWFSDAISLLFQKCFIVVPMNFAQFGRHNVVYIVKI